MNASRRGNRVSLSNAPQTSGDADGFFADCDPFEVWASIEPVAPISADSIRVQGHFVTIPYHPQVTIDTRVLYGTRELFVKGVQNVNEKNREMRLYCEEAV